MTLDEVRDIAEQLGIELDMYLYGTRTKAGSKRIRK